MSLSQFAQFFKDTYQENFQKRLTAMEIANTELRSDLTYGKSVTRFRADFSNVLVRPITKLTDGVIDPIADSAETLTVDQRYGTKFAIDEVEEITQAGPLQPAVKYGRETARKLAVAVDAFVLSETQNAFADFDTGNLTTNTASGVPIALTTTNVESMMTRTKARLRRNNIDIENVAWVIDSEAASIFESRFIGKEFDSAGNAWKNGLAGNVLGAEVYVSENLTGEALFTLDTNPTAGDTMSINGIEVEFVSSLTGAGQVLIGGSAAITLASLISLWNNPTTTNSTQQAFSTADANDVTFKYRLTATAVGSTQVQFVGIGSGRLIVIGTMTAGTNIWVDSFIHAYYGRKGAIDVVLQKELTMQMRQEPKQTTTNVLNEILWGQKTFTDGAQQFLDVHIAEPVTNN